MPFFEKMLIFFFQKSVQEAWFIYYILRPLHPPIVKIFFFGCFPGHLAFCFNTGSEKFAKNASFSVFDLDTRGDLSFIINKAIYIVKSPPIFFSLGNAHFLKRLQYQIVVKIAFCSPNRGCK